MIYVYKIYIYISKLKYVYILYAMCYLLYIILSNIFIR